MQDLHLIYNVPMDKMHITQSQARKFLVAYHGLDRYGSGSKENAIMKYFQKVGSVQFDPLDVCGKNAELVLQSRIRNFKPRDLSKLLYEKRLLTEGWDKMMCIYSMSEFPYFKRRRDRDKDYFQSDKCKDLRAISGAIIQDLQDRGPLSSLDLDFHEVIDWSWAQAKLSRATLEMLFFSGRIAIHSRVHSRRKYDLVERIVPDKLLQMPDPNEKEDDHSDWRVLRRLASIGLYYDKSGDGWLGMMKKKDRDQSIQRLISKEQVIPIQIEGILFNFNIPSKEIELLNRIVKGERRISKKISFLAPLDNFMWDRSLVEILFDFKYRWEVYKPLKEREYGYYVLPVLYGDKIIARFEPFRDKKQSKLIVKNWWWEKNIKVNDQMKKSISKAIGEFADFLEVETDLKASLKTIYNS